MGFGPGDVVGLIWSHPIASVVVALLFTPPLFPIVVFFSPLLISTVLVVLAMISMGSDGDDGGATPGGYGHSHYKRDWHEQEETDQVMFDDDDDGPLLNDEDRRVHKRRKGLAASHDDGWLDKVKSWEETGRAWVDSVFHQETRRPNSEPFFSSPSAVTETREVRFAQPIPQPSSLTPPPTLLSHSPAPAHSGENVPPPVKEAAGDEARGPAAAERDNRASEISAEPDEDPTGIAAQSLRAFPIPDEEKRSKGAEDRGEESRSKGKRDEEEPKEAVQSKSFTVPREEASAAAAENKRGASTNDRADQNGAAAAAGHESSSTGKSAPSSSAAAQRERHAEHNRTPSVAVTLSEKLNVPLEDMMSLLAGDEKPSSSSVRAVAHGDGGWSSSDDELAKAAAAAGKGGEQNQAPSEKSSK